MATTEQTPYDIYNFFLSLRDSLPDENDYSDLVGTLFIPHDVMPLSETLENVLPYFRRSSNPNLFTTFQMMMRNTEQNPAFESTFMRVCEALDILEKVETALQYSKQLFEGYLAALQLDNASASHEQIMNNLQRFLNEKCDPQTQSRVRKVFAEEGAAEELGLADSVLATASDLINDDALYIQILQTLQLNHRQNLPWETVVSRIQKLVEEKKPSVWPVFRNFLDEVHRGGQGNNYYNQTTYYPYQDTTTNYHVDYDDSDYAAFCEQYLDDQPEIYEEGTTFLEQKFANVSLADTASRDGVDAKKSQHQQTKVF